MEFNKRHKEALRFFAKYPNLYEYEPRGVGTLTMNALVENGYVMRQRARIGWMYKITPKGARIVEQWVEADDVQARLDKWNRNAK